MTGEFANGIAFNSCNINNVVQVCLKADLVWLNEVAFAGPSSSALERFRCCILAGEVFNSGLPKQLPGARLIHWYFAPPNDQYLLTAYGRRGVCFCSLSVCLSLQRMGSLFCDPESAEARYYY